MAETGLTRFPVVARRDGTLVGMVGLTDLLTARARILEAEQRRERTLGTRLRLLDVFGPGRAA
jgi:CBS domain-containing protein